MKALALKNIPAMLVTEATFQLSRGSLYRLAPLKVLDISVTDMVFQLSKGLLKIAAP
ncbi:hypothetical protein NYZ99_17335 [Maribacter litopenaei]|uniref:Uncharacterized protein n=1 Tax=Maribacter litopenaei TaxID=2976127 RepID=A0ABY5Y6E7_9FLAO|nr:hypothetical protein [Maribacter litopenaei]UWX54611.1 hypothetical protein NYZ99_17335 [Maribacter litopenaei]